MHKLQERWDVREEDILCNLTRADQQGEDEFECEAYEKIEIVEGD